MMEREDQYDDLTALFEAQDDALKSDAFVEQVMAPIHKRARWRAPLLFGAGGIGIGAAASQIGGLWQTVRANVPSFTPEIDVQISDLSSAESVLQSQPLFLGLAVLVIISCALLVVTERA